VEVLSKEVTERNERRKQSDWSNQMTLSLFTILSLSKHAFWKLKFRI
jgi:hypothetical protein